MGVQAGEAACGMGVLSYARLQLPISTPLHCCSLTAAPSLPPHAANLIDRWDGRALLDFYKVPDAAVLRARGKSGEEAKLGVVSVQLCMVGRGGVVAALYRRTRMC